MSDQRPTKPRQDSDKLEAEVLANERTFLAWVRTSIAVMGLGFVIARFGLCCGSWPRKSIRKRTRVPPGLGAIIISFGALLTVLAGWRYHVVNFAIERGESEGDPRMVVIITVGVAVLALAIITYMFFAAERA